MVESLVYDLKTLGSHPEPFHVLSKYMEFEFNHAENDFLAVQGGRLAHVRRLGVLLALFEHFKPGSVTIKDTGSYVVERPAYTHRTISGGTVVVDAGVWVNSLNETERVAVEEFLDETKNRTLTDIVSHYSMPHVTCPNCGRQPYTTTHILDEVCHQCNVHMSYIGSGLCGLCGQTEPCNDEDEEGVDTDVA